MRLIIYVAVATLFLITPKQKLAAQKQYNLTLDEVILLAQSDAPDVLLAQTRKDNAYWQYQSFKADLKPQIDLNASLADLNRSIEQINLPDGSAQFINRSLINNSLSVSLSQVLPFSGGRIFASSSLDRLDILRTSNSPSQTSYLAAPIFIGFQQPLNGYNAFKWDRQIESIQYNQSERAYSESMENVAFDAVGFFFDVLTAQLAMDAATLDKAIADTLYQIGQGRYSVGNISESELLQLEVNIMNTDASLARAKLDLQRTIELLRNFLGIREEVFFNLSTPDQIPSVEIDPTLALEQAKTNRSDLLDFQLQLLSAEQNVEETKSRTGLNAELFGRVGLTQTAQDLSDAYRSPLDQERFTVGLNIPIADWGKSRSQYEIAKSSLQLTKLTVEQDRISFERNVQIKAQQFDLVRNNVALAERSWQAAQKRFGLTRNRYSVGKVSVTELNLAIQDQERLRNQYVQALREFWVAYYELRLLTLYDFINQSPLATG